MVKIVLDLKLSFKFVCYNVYYLYLGWYLFLLGYKWKEIQLLVVFLLLVGVFDIVYCYYMVIFYDYFFILLENNLGGVGKKIIVDKVVFFKERID